MSAWREFLERGHTPIAKSTSVTYTPTSEGHVSKAEEKTRSDGRDWIRFIGVLEEGLV